jgi:hypothetical protein
MQHQLLDIVISNYTRNKKRKCELCKRLKLQLKWKIKVNNRKCIYLCINCASSPTDAFSFSNKLGYINHIVLLQKEFQCYGYH